jgi:2-polyprenyl-6-methoxyphenol hydroxylase-like FAD-dependent oxidoreductase
MNRSLRVLVVGCGTAGAAAALFLQRAGHVVTVVEQVADPQPVGAGIMLQPVGQAVLAELGLLDEVLRAGARIDGLRVVRDSARQAGSQHRADLIHLHYADVDKTYFGLGLHRGVLFQCLYQAVQRANIRVHLGLPGTGLRREGCLRWLVTREGELGPFDLVVVADGSKSQFRDDTQLTLRADRYPWGALWYMADDPDALFERELFQVVRGTRRLLGLLPTGLGPDGKRKVSFFFSVPSAEAEVWRNRPIAEIHQEFTQLAPECEPVLSQLTDASQLLFSGYYDVVMHPWNTLAVVHLGDAAHAMSPQLGQGANLALMDAWVLSEALKTSDHVNVALDLYSKRRADHLRYYQYVTRWLTPFFQSDYAALGMLRDAFMPVMTKVKPLRQAMVLGMCGIVDGYPWRRVALPDATALRALSA